MSRTTSELRKAAEDAGFAEDPIASELLAKLGELEKGLIESRTSAAAGKRATTIACVVAAIAVLAGVGFGLYAQNSARSAVHSELAAKNAEITRLATLNSEQGKDAIALAEKLNSTIKDSERANNEMKLELQQTHEKQSQLASDYARKLEQLLDHSKAASPQPGGQPPK